MGESVMKGEEEDYIQFYVIVVTIFKTCHEIIFFLQMLNLMFYLWGIREW